MIGINTLPPFVVMLLLIFGTEKKTFVHQLIIIQQNAGTVQSQPLEYPDGIKQVYMEMVDRQAEEVSLFIWLIHLAHAIATRVVLKTKCELIASYRDLSQRHFQTQAYIFKPIYLYTKH